MSKIEQQVGEMSPRSIMAQERHNRMEEKSTNIYDGGDWAYSCVTIPNTLVQDSTSNTMTNEESINVQTVRPNFMTPIVGTGGEKEYEGNEWAQHVINGIHPKVIVEMAESGEDKRVESLPLGSVCSMSTHWSNEGSNGSPGSNGRYNRFRIRTAVPSDQVAWPGAGLAASVAGAFAGGSGSPMGAAGNFNNVILQMAEDLPPAPTTKNTGAPITEHVEAEIQFWNKRKETDPDVYDRLKSYWDNLGWTPAPIDSTMSYKELVGASKWTPSGVPWSAAFVSYGLKGTGFEPAASHYKYTENVQLAKSAGWKAYSITKNPNTPISIGDVLIKPRGKGSYNKQAVEYWNTHGDLVYKIDGTSARLAGGNVSDTGKDVGSVSLDSNGILTSAGPYVVILKKD